MYSPNNFELLEFIKNLMIRTQRAVFIDKAKIAYFRRNAPIARIVKIRQPPSVIDVP